MRTTTTAIADLLAFQLHLHVGKVTGHFFVEGALEGDKILQQHNLGVLWAVLCMFVGAYKMGAYQSEEET